jgi:hypothetical protein
MADRVASHYSENLKLADAIAEKLRGVGKNLDRLLCPFGNIYSSLPLSLQTQIGVKRYG